MSDPIVSIVIPTYNRLWGIKDCIESILAQSFTAWKIIVMDDAGSQPVKEFVEMLNNPKIQYQRQSKNLGVSGNWESGIKKVKTKYFSILMDDDWYGPNFLKNRLDVFENYPDISVVYGPYNRIQKDVGICNQVGTRKIGLLNENELTSAMISRDSFIGTAMFQTEHVLKILDQSKNYGLIIDYAINVLVPLLNKKGGFCLETYDFFYRDHSETLSKTRKNQVLIECIQFLNDIKNHDFLFKRQIVIEIYQMLKNESWTAPEWFNRISWALRALRVRPFYSGGYWNLLKSLVGIPRV